MVCKILILKHLYLNNTFLFIVYKIILNKNLKIILKLKYYVYICRDDKYLNKNPMNNFSITSIIDQYGLDAKEVAVQLFPENKHPMPALARVVNGEALLNTDQIAKLSFMVGVPVDNLFTGAKWISRGSKSGLVVLENSDYRAEMNTDTWITKVYHKNSLFHESIIVNGSAVTLSEYIKELDKLILNHNK